MGFCGGLIESMLWILAHDALPDRVPDPLYPRFGKRSEHVHRLLIMAAIDYLRVSMCRERTQNEQLTDTNDVCFVLRIESRYHRSRAPEVAADGVEALARVGGFSSLVCTLNVVFW